MTTRILTFCNKNYLEFAFIWGDCIKRLGIDNYLVVATDAITYDRLAQRGIKTRLVDIGKTGYTSITGQYRMGIVRQYLADGIDVLLTDVDTIWEKNILPEYENHTGVDIYASQTPAYKNNGVSFKRIVLAPFIPPVQLNCGFLYIRSTPDVLKFFDQYMAKLAGCTSDQPPFNALLGNTRWDVTSDSFWVRANRRRFTLLARCFRSDINGYNRDFNLKLCLVSMLKVQRGYLDDGGYIYHYRLLGKDRLKMQGSLSRLLPKRAAFPDRTGSKLKKLPGRLLFSVLHKRHKFLIFLLEGISTARAFLFQYKTTHAMNFSDMPGLRQAHAAIEVVFRNRILKLYRHARSRRADVARILSQDEFVDLYTCFFEVAHKWEELQGKAIFVDAVFTPEALMPLRKIQAENLLTVASADRMSLEELFQLQQVLCPPDQRGGSQEAVRTPENPVP